MVPSSRGWSRFVLAIVLVLYGPSLSAQETITLRPSLYTEADTSSFSNPASAVDENLFSAASAFDIIYCSTVCLLPRTRVTHWWGFATTPGGYEAVTLSVRWSFAASFLTYSPDTATSQGLIEYSIDDGTTWNTMQLFAGPPNMSSGTITSTAALPPNQDLSRVRVRATADVRMTHCMSCGRGSGAYDQMYVYDVAVTSIPKVADPVFTPGPGNYYTPQDVSASTPTAGAFITYTTDGSEPTEISSAPPIPQVASTTTIKARAFRAGWAPSNVVTASYRWVFRVTDFGAICDGTANNTTAIQNALAAAQSGDGVEFPAGQCNHDDILLVVNKNNLEIYGAGATATILMATVAYQSALNIVNSSSVTVRDLGARATCGLPRSRLPVTSGFRVFKGSNVRFYRVTTAGFCSDGIFFESVDGGGVWDSSMWDLKSSAVFITNDPGDMLGIGSRNITVENNSAYRIGDDCYASVAHNDGEDGEFNFGDLNEDLVFRNNWGEDCGQNVPPEGGGGSGFDIEGSHRVQITGNHITRSSVQGIRIGSSEEWDSHSVNDVEVWDNYLIDVGTRTEQGWYMAIDVFAEFADVSNVRIHDNYIENAWGGYAFDLSGSVNPMFYVHDVQVHGNNIMDYGFIMWDCTQMDPTTTYNVSLYGNRLIRESYWVPCEP